MNRRLLFVKILLLISFTTLKSQISLNDVAGSNASSMMALQQISVTIGGEFIVNGSFPASATERVDQFITRTYNTYYAAILTAIKDENSAIVFRKKYEKFALRNIELIHKDGRKEVVDLANFRLTGDFSQNPYIKEGDLIIFPTLDLETNFISVTGAVNKELEFQFVEGDDLQTALFFARGINTAYKNVNKAIISRLEDNGQKEVEIEVNLNSDTKLKSGDRIRVIFDERNNFNYRVLVIGEVNRPGYIPISRNSTTLKEVIIKAGGFTENASLKFSELIREYDSYSALRKKSIEESYNNSNS
ncbi:MAG: SLBB domain-containing protein, partial [Ignavibacteriae bacterium]|nr:SLBB domain-containing protein [Ignavibacteriota bacterium]